MTTAPDPKVLPAVALFRGHDPGQLSRLAVLLSG